MSAAGCVFLILGVISCVASQNTLTEEEIQILKDNGYTVIPNEDAGTITYEHHGLPDHTASGGWGNPNSAEMVNHSYTVPLRPTVAEVKGCAGGLGIIGLSISGGAFYNPYNAAGWDAVNGECAEDLDDCHGHPSPDGTYHYHSVPKCLYNGELRDKFLGVALDGYPILGPMDSSGNNWTTADLDECHGHYYNGRYVYRGTYEFPYILSCFHGNSVKMQGGQGGPPPGGERQPPPGIQGPPGMENDKCFNAENPDWQSLICRVVCPNAGRDVEDCRDSSTDLNGSPHIMPLYTSIIMIVACMFFT